MKRIVIIILSLVLLMSTTGCGGKGSAEPETETEQVSATVEPKDEPKDEPKVAPKEVKEKNDFYFDGEIVEIEDLQIKIIKTKVIAVGEEGNDYGDKPVFAIWYETTNKSDKEFDSIDAWLAVFEAVQDNDDNMVNKLGVGSLPDEAHLDTQMNVIKQGGTVENSIAYELTDEITPVTLKATRGYGGDKLGEMDYAID